MDVLIIGAGYTGLSAACHLSDKKLNVMILEADQRVGGRTLESIVSENFRLELGGQYISPDQKRVSKLSAELGLETFPAWSNGDNFLALNDQVERFRSSPASCLSKKLGASSEIEKEIEDLFKQLSKMCHTVSCHSPWTLATSQEWDSITFHSWLDAELKSPLSKIFFRLMTNQAFSTEPSQISLLQMLWFLKTSHGIPSWATGGVQGNRIVGGTQLLADRLSLRLEGKITFYEKTIKIEQDSEKVTVVTSRDTFHAKYALICLPPQLINQVQYVPPLPSDLYRAFSSFQSGNTMKVQAVYERPFWREAGWSGNGMSFEGPQTFTYDNSAPDGVPGVLLGFLSASHATKWNQKSQTQRKLAVLESWAKVFGEEALHPLEYIEMDWMSNQYARGGHGCHFPPGIWNELGPALGGERMPNFKRLFWAASDLAKDWTGYLEGALFAGEQVAEEIAEVIQKGS